MTLITKPDFTYVWASGGAIVAPNDTKKQQGWVAEAPPFQYDNWLQNRQDQMLAHINQRGIPAWDGLTNYEAGGLSYVQGSDGKVYKSIASSGPSSVVSNPTTDGTNTYWTIAFADVGAFLTQAAGDTRYTQRSNNLSDLTNVAAARTNLALGTAATATLTTSATDTTAGRVLKVGDFGVGTPIPTTNLNTLTGTGLFTCGDVTGTPGTSLLGWWVHQIDAGTGFWKNQTAWAQSNPAAQYVRASGDGTTWNPWVPVVFNNSPAFTGTPTAPTAAAGTNTTQLANTAFVQATVYAAPMLGVGQTWQVVTGSRSNGTVYTNSTGKPIQLYITGDFNTATLTIGGVALAFQDYSGASFINTIIPNNTTYSLTWGGSAPLVWAELR